MPESAGTVLCVDDNRDNLQSMSWILRLEGFQVLEAASGQEALALARRQPDLVILDVRLSDMSGFDVCKSIKTAPETATVPVLMLSGYFVQGRHRIHGLEGGADAYLTKPIEPRELLAHVKSALRARRAEQAARNAARQWQLTFDAVSDGVCLLDAEGTIQRCNGTMARLLGGVPEDFVGRKYRDVQEAAFGKHAGPPSHPVHELSGREVEELILGGRWYHVTVDPAGDLGEGALGAVLVWSDVSDRKQSEEAVRRAEAKYRGIFENAVEGIFQMTSAGRFLTANPALARMLGYDSSDELLAVGDVGSTLHADRATIAEFAQRLDERGTLQGFEAQLRRKDGGALWVSLSGRAVRDEDGQVAYYEGLVENIQERKRLEEQVRQAQKMEAVGRLAGGVAHDFNNLLTIVYSCSELLLEDPGLDEATRGLIGEIRSAGKRAAALTQQLLTFSRKKLLLPKEVELNAVVAGLEMMLRRLIREDVDLVAVLDPSAGYVKADPAQIEQVVLNLAVNARDAMPKGGKLIIQTRTVTLDEEGVANRPGLRPGDYVVLAVTDTGTGMDETVRARLFEPFFTTKGIGKGTGLGLATVYGIIQQSGGRVEVQSELGQGSTFTVYLPRVDRPLPETGPAVVQPEAPALPSGNETILLVEDEDAVRAPLREILLRGGYRVLEACNGVDALERVAGWNDGIDLLLTDLVMPQMNGRQLAEELRAQRPGLRVLYLSGYNDEASTPADFDGAAFLYKPFTPATLAKTIRDVLDGPRPAVPDAGRPTEAHA